jgi:cytochrome oxidase Cu insertion factor (SCO1/SenC/PrrC family)
VARVGTVTLALAFGALLGLLGWPAVARSVDLESLSTARAEARIEGRALPDILLHLADGSRVTLAEVGRGQDLLVTFYYRRCAGVCTPFLQWIADATSAVGGLGSDYRVLALSFDGTDGVDDLAGQARALGLLDDPRWLFAVTNRESLAMLTNALEFSYRLRPGSDQYDHGSLLVAVRDGRVLRSLRGAPGRTDRLREMVWELRGRFVPSYRIEGGPTVRCLGFDPSTGRPRLDWGMLVLVLPALAALAAVLALFRSKAARGVTPVTR